MPLWLKRSLFLLVVGVAAWVEGYYLAPYGFSTVAVALAITVILAIGWMRTYWKGKSCERDVPALQLYRRTTRLIPLSDALSICERASGFVVCPNFPYAKLCGVAGYA